MISVNYICNGCGVYTSYNGKNDKQLNILKVDMTNYLMFTSGFKLKEPTLDLHFCDGCYSDIQRGVVNVNNYGSAEVLRKKCDTLQSDLLFLEADFKLHKSKVKDLLKDV